MKILVLGGSPKGETSITMQYVRWIKENLDSHEVESIQVASRIAALEQDAAAFAVVIEKVRQADAILWAFPLYILTVCSQYKRFIELIWDRGANEAFRGKYSASLSTSIHFFDHTAHEYIRGVSEDLGMAFTGFFSAKMRDLLEPECRRQVLVFALDMITAAEQKQLLPRRTVVLPSHVGTSTCAPLASEPASAAVTAPMSGKRALVLIDYPEKAIGAMARRAAAVLVESGHQVEILPLEDMGIKGGCLGCLKCGQANHCVWEGKDGFIECFKTKVMPADLLIIAGTIKNRSFSARWQAFLDRSFFKTHQQTLKPGFPK